MILIKYNGIPPQMPLGMLQRRLLKELFTELKLERVVRAKNDKFR